MRWFIRGVVFGVLAVQVAALWPSWFSDSVDSRDLFSQTMYSDAYVCSARYELDMGDGDLFELPIVSYSRGPIGRDDMQRDVVPAFQAWMCSQFTTGAEMTRVYGNVRCRTALDGFDAPVNPDLCSRSRLSLI
jgi:hypothetical protein